MNKNVIKIFILLAFWLLKGTLYAKQPTCRNGEKLKILFENNIVVFSKNEKICNMKPSSIFLILPDTMKLKEVQAFMPGHNHGLLEKTSFKKIDKRTYKIFPFHLFMPGLWDIEITFFHKAKQHKIKKSVWIGPGSSELP